jgi:integrase
MATWRQGRGRPRKMSDRKTLSELGITRQQASDWERMAQIPEKQFEEILNRPGRKPTSAGVLREARLLPPRVKPTALTPAEWRTLWDACPEHCRPLLARLWRNVGVRAKKAAAKKKG